MPLERGLALQPANLRARPCSRDFLAFAVRGNAKKLQSQGLNRERARARNKKQGTPNSLEEKQDNSIAPVRKVEISGSEKK